MKKKAKLVHKVKRLIKRAGLPRWLHHYGPKKYEFYNHALAYLIKQQCRLSYARTTQLLRGLGFKCPCPSAIWTSLNKMPLKLWQRLLKVTAPKSVNIVAIDGTGMSRPLPSPYYYKRIDKPYPVEIPLKLSIAIETRTKKILALRVRAKRAHDIRDAKYLIKRLPSKPNKIVADKGYDAEWLHQFCKAKNIKAVIPIRWNNRARHNKMSLRRNQNIKQKTYGRREMVESVFGSTKKLFGASVSSIKISAQRAEMYCRAIAYNLFCYLVELFE